MDEGPACLGCGPGWHEQNRSQSPQGMRSTAKRAAATETWGKASSRERGPWGAGTGCRSTSYNPASREPS